MLTEELQRLVAAGESDTVEFKRSTGQRTEAARTACAMLNGRGGFILFGIEPDSRQTTGQQVGASTLEDVVGELRRIEPYVPLQPETYDVAEGRNVLLVRVPDGPDKPYTFDGRPYVRQGPTTAAMPRELYERMVVERRHPIHRWEIQPAHEITLNDLDKAEITRTVDEAIRRGRMDEPGTRDPAELLKGLRVMREDGILLNAAVALFARSNRLLPYYPQCLLRLARFRGTTMSVFEDNRQIHGNAFELLAAAQRFMREYLPVAGRIVPNLFERLDDPLYPPEALREALANALCHRDYSVGGGSIGIGIFDDRLEISSTGRLPSGLKPKDLTRPHTSRPWNPLIAGVFYRRGIIESWGRGTLKMIELTEQAGLTPPEFEERAGSVIVRFRPTQYVPPSRVEHDLTPLHKQLLSVLAQEGPVSLSGIYTSLNESVPIRTIQHALTQLREFDLIEVSGHARGARWRLKGIPLAH